MWIHVADPRADEHADPRVREGTRREDANDEGQDNVAHSITLEGYARSPVQYRLPSVTGVWGRMNSQDASEAGLSRPVLSVMCGPGMLMRPSASGKTGSMGKTLRCSSLVNTI